ncbi:MAG: sulfatase-like hydrolase/transferase, partial [Spongiibacter marinus]|uniref:sulfatase-like hydrolase/transferase n=1 Tax=Spongiibacter marinus TaxID=354246 RepID=UPI003C555474
MRNRLLFLCGMVAISLFMATSYFGLPNPSHLGLISTLYSSGVLVLLMLLCLTIKNSRLAAVVFSASCFIYLMLTVGNWWIFQYFRSYFNFEHLSFLRDGRSGLKSAADFDYISQSMWQALISSFLLITFFLLRRGGVSRSAAVCAFFVFSAITVPAKVYIDTKYNELEKRNLFTLSPYIISPVHAFFYSYGQRGVSPSDGWSKFKSMNDPLIKDKGLAEGQEKLNIIILTLESFRSSFVGEYGSKRGLTPNFDKLAKKSYLFRNFYANSNFTIKGENAILCSFFDHNAKLSIAEYE